MFLLSGHSIAIRFFTDEGLHNEDFVSFYDLNPAGKGLDFTDNPEDEEPFLRYAVQLKCINPIKDISRTPLPPLEDIAEGVEI